MDSLFNLEELAILFTAYAPKVIGALLTLIIGFWITARIVNVVDKALHKRNVDETIHPFLKSMVSVGLKVMVLLAVASMFGIETTSFIAILGALAFAVGMALQGSLGHFASGVLILVFKPYEVGDLVEIGGGQTGHVKEIQIFNTVLVTLDNKNVIVPNGVVTSNVITNISGQGTIGVEFTFGIGYNDSIDKARDIIMRIGKECPFILDDVNWGVTVGSWGDSSVNLVARPFCNSDKYWETYFYMHEHVKKAFDKEGISIPFPQMDVHFPSGSPK